jgi:hypothetical protein
VGPGCRDPAALANDPDSRRAGIIADVARLMDDRSLDMKQRGATPPRGRPSNKELGNHANRLNQRAVILVASSRMAKIRTCPSLYGVRHSVRSGPVQRSDSPDPLDRTC